MKYKALIYDMDGLMVDSMIHWLELDKIFFEPKGIIITENLVRQLTGKSEKENLAFLKKEFNMSVEMDEIFAARREHIDIIYKEKTIEMPGVSGLIKKAREKGLKQAVASGAPHHTIKIVVERFGWVDHFDELFSVEHVEHKGKPEPDVFLHTAKKLGLKPEECVVLEDAENGVVAAKRAGMACIAVPDKRWSFGDFDQADLIVDSLENEEVYKFLGIH